MGAPILPGPAASATYDARRAWITEYFDRTAADGWAALTSDAPVGFVRRTVRAGRDRMRATLLRWLPEDLRGARVLDAGCGTGAVSVALAARGAHVVGVDLSPTLVALARRRTPSGLAGRVELHAGDMLDASLGAFDHVVAMDSLIHYAAPDAVTAMRALAARTRRSLVFTVAPRTGLLALKHGVGRLLPRTQRAPAIEPIALPALHASLAEALGGGWRVAREARVSTGFYTSHATELVAASHEDHDGRDA
ncbi:MAG: magnesium protoporphyrin IX methyltransferase [Gemmatirosa sp.]